MAATNSFPAKPTVAELVLAYQNAVQALQSLITNFNAGGVTQTYLEAIAIALGSDASSIPGNTTTGAYELLTQVEASAFVSTAIGNDLDLKAADFGVSRKPAAYAVAQVVFTANPPPLLDLIIPFQTFLVSEPADPNGAPIVFYTTSPTTIPAGATSPVAPMLVIATSTGVVGNVGPGTITRLLSNIGSVSVTNPLVAAGGADIEQDDSPVGGLRARTLLAVPNANDCTMSAIVAAARSYPGITSAYVLDNLANDLQTFSPGVSQLFVDDGTGNLANNSTLTPVVTLLQNDINAGKHRAAGTSITVQTSIIVGVTVAMGIDVSQVYINTIGPASSVTDAVQAAVYAYINQTQLGSVVTLASVIAAAKAIAGVSNIAVSSVLINGATADFFTAPNQTPRVLNLSDVAVTSLANVNYNG